MVNGYANFRDVTITTIDGEFVYPKFINGSTECSELDSIFLLKKPIYTNIIVNEDSSTLKITLRFLPYSASTAGGSGYGYASHPTNFGNWALTRTPDGWELSGDR